MVTGNQWFQPDLTGFPEHSRQDLLLENPIPYSLPLFFGSTNRPGLGNPG
jgi:hypothetical protein